MNIAGGSGNGAPARRHATSRMDSPADGNRQGGHNGGGSMNNPDTKPCAKRYYRKRVKLFRLLHKMKLWTSRRGILHGIRSIEEIGDQVLITTHCGKIFLVANSSNSRAAPRDLRNKWFRSVCGSCGVPQWKLAKYASTRFSRHYGSTLQPEPEAQKPEGGLGPC